MSTERDTPRLIEVAFPLRQASLDSVHEKNVRHGHISTLHIWPARRPLAACRAALLATLLPDPGDAKKRQELVERIGGKVVRKVKKKGGKDVVVEETEGGILHWKRESEPDIEWFREEIRKAYGGRAPKVLDPFAGGGAIPLEAMRLGCETTAVDINPVAWFILKCTLEYPQKLAGKKRPLPEFVKDMPDFMEAWKKRHSKKKGKKKRKKGAKKQEATFLFETHDEGLEADLAWHVRAWGAWVLERARKDLADHYPTYMDFEPLDKAHPKRFKKQPMTLVQRKKDGTPDTEKPNADYSEDYLADKRNARWVVKPTVAYLWARTVKCKNCRATVPLLKTRWLCKKEKKRVVLTMKPDAKKKGVVFGIKTDVPQKGGNAAQKRAHDKALGAGTMSRSGAQCPCCEMISTMEDIRLEGRAGRLGSVMTAVVVDGAKGKEYRLPTKKELKAAKDAEKGTEEVFKDVPFGIPNEPLPGKGTLGFRVPLYGFDEWAKLFTPRQLVALGTFVKWTRRARDAMIEEGYGGDWIEAVPSYASSMVDRLANQGSTGATWNNIRETIEQTFARFALPMHWDYPETNALGDASGGYASAVTWVFKVVEHLLVAFHEAPVPGVLCQSAITVEESSVDVVVTDPPYYDAIPYSDLMDFFYIWLRRSLSTDQNDVKAAFSSPLAPKWDAEAEDGELIDDSSRFGNDASASKMAYENGMARAFQACHNALRPDGRLVIVFAHKHPDAWETLVSAIIRSGFTVDGSWPIDTERKGGVRNFGRASLSSSVWLVCKKRREDARPGWDNRVLGEMRENITVRLRDFWDAGIRGPDFVWSATGPALEAYSRHPVVKKANEPGETLKVHEFLGHVRRMVVDFVVGRVLTESGAEVVAGLDDVTTYYLLHRHDFGMAEAPAGACILYAVSCGLSDSKLADQFDILARKGKSASPATEEGDEEAEETAPSSGSGSMVKLKTWKQRKGKRMGYETPSGAPVPLIDQIHRLMHLWKAGDVVKVNEYLDAKGLRSHKLFQQLLQALIELSTGEERSLLESISNHVATLEERHDDGQTTLKHLR